MAPSWVGTPVLGGYDQAASELSNTNIRTNNQKFLERVQSVVKALCKTPERTLSRTPELRVIRTAFFCSRPLTLP